MYTRAAVNDTARAAEKQLINRFKGAIKVGCIDPVELDRLVALSTESNLSPKAKSLAFWGLARLGYKNKAVLLSLVPEPINSLKTQDLLTLAHSCRLASIDLPSVSSEVMLRMHSGFSSWSPNDQWMSLHSLSSTKTIDSSKRVGIFRFCLPRLKIDQVSSKGLVALSQAYVKTLHGFPSECLTAVSLFARLYLYENKVTLVGSALVAKALAAAELGAGVRDCSIEEPQNSVWLTLVRIATTPHQIDNSSCFAWLLFLDAFATRGVTPEILDNFALLGKSVVKDLDTEGLARAAQLITRLVVEFSVGRARYQDVY